MRPDDDLAMWPRLATLNNQPVGRDEEGKPRHESGNDTLHHGIKA
jgi:hypothetical protein